MDRHPLGEPQRSPQPACLDKPHNSLLQQALRLGASVTLALNNKQGRRLVLVALARRRERLVQLAQAYLAAAEAPSAKHPNSNRSSKPGLVRLVPSNSNNKRVVACSVVGARLVPTSRNPHSVRHCISCSYELLSRPCLRCWHWHGRVWYNWRVWAATRSTATTNRHWFVWSGAAASATSWYNWRVRWLW